MDMTASPKDLHPENKAVQEDLLLNIIKEVCCEKNTKLSPKLIEKVNRIIADCDMSHYASFYKLYTSNPSTTTVLGFTPHAAVNLTFEEQAELNDAIVIKIQDKLPLLTAELVQLQQNAGRGKKSRNEEIQELQQCLDEKLNTLQQQENEKVELMMEWLSHRLQDVSTFGQHTNEMMTLKTQILELKSKILHFRILCNIFTETNQSIKAYSEIHKDIKECIHDTELRIQNYKNIIAND